MLKRFSLRLICIIVLLFLCGCSSNNKLHDIEYRKAYCSYYKNDTSLSSGLYYVDIETKDEKTVTIHYFTEYFKVYAKDNFSKQILEGNCTFSGVDDQGKYIGYNKSCEYDNDYYVVKYDMDEEKNLDSLINEFQSKEYECIEIKKQTNDDLIIGTWKREYIFSSGDGKEIDIYKFYDDGTFEKVDITERYNINENDLIMPYYEKTNKGYYSFDGINIYTIIPYGKGEYPYGISGYNLKYDKDNDIIDTDYFRVDD